MLNTMSRNARKGIHMGVDERPLVICVDEDFDKVYHFDVPCALHRIEVRIQYVFDKKLEL